ncbi:hypothetical protein Dimus_002426 [Dionaea muscipula]
MAAMAPERSRTLHNFSLPLSWGVQRLLRCSKVNPHNDDDDAAAAGHTRQSEASARIRWESPDYEQRNRRSGKNNYRSSPSRSSIGRSFRTSGDAGGGGRDEAREEEEEESIEVVRQKLMLDLHKEVDQMKVKMRCDGGGEKEIEEPMVEAVAAAVTLESRPWNLRTRRAACKEPIVNSGGGKILKTEQPKPSISPLRTEIKSPRLRNGVEEEASGGGGGGGNCGEKRPRAKFSVPLSRQEVEDDFMEILGKRPPRKQKKRPKYVQKQMDTLFPGLWLSEITGDMYRVNEIPELVK